MATFASSDIRAQVELLTRRSGMSVTIDTWIKRTIATVLSKGFWQHSIKTVRYNAQVRAMVGATSHWHNLSVVSYGAAALSSYFSDLMGFYRIQHVALTTGTQTGSVNIYYNQLTRLQMPDLYAQMQGKLVTTYGTPMSWYAPVFYEQATGGAATSNFYFPHLLLHPSFQTNDTSVQSGGALMIRYQSDMDAADPDNSWVLQKYPLVVLHGVLRYARLYLGDIQGYLIEKAAFENGIKDMLHTEEVATADTPVLRGPFPEDMGRLLGGA